MNGVARVVVEFDVPGTTDLSEESSLKALKNAIKLDVETRIQGRLAAKIHTVTVKEVTITGWV